MTDPANGRVWATPVGVSLGPLHSIPDGKARNYVLQLRAGRFHGFVIRRGEQVHAMSIAAPMPACRWRSGSTII